jgi:hypothetical protein
MGRRNPMFYLLLPFALQQGEAAFINQSLSFGGKNILSPYATIFIDVLFFITSIIALFLIKTRHKAISWTGTILIWFFLGYVVLLWIISFMNYPDIEEVLLTGRQFIYISLSYFLWIGIFQSVTRDQYEQFIRLMFYVTPVSALLYILNSAKIISLYDPALIYQEVGFGTDVFLRDFRTIPLWLIPVMVLSFLSLVTGLFRISKAIIVVNIMVLPVALLFTFTRSLVIMVLMQTGFLFLLFFYRLNGRLIRNGILALAFLAVPLVIMQRSFPGQSSYFQERFLSVKQEGGEDQNLKVRINYVVEARRVVSENSIFLGVGMNRFYYPRMNATGAWIADSTIPYFLIHTGWIGVLLIFGMVFVFFIDSFLYFLKTEDWLVGYLSGYFLTVFISALVMGGEMLTGSVWTLANFALYSVIKFNSWRAADQTIEG